MSLDELLNLSFLSFLYKVDIMLPVIITNYCYFPNKIIDVKSLSGTWESYGKSLTLQVTEVKRVCF